jgi:hypothetical protein
MESIITYRLSEEQLRACERPRSVTVEGSGALARKLAEQAKAITFTGLARDWTVKITEVGTARPFMANFDHRFRLLLSWQVPCRDSGASLPLVYRDEFQVEHFEHLYGSLVVWVNDALRYVMRHEADETILLSDGTRPFDPHRKETL